MSGSFRKFVQFKFTDGQLPGIESRFQFSLRFQASFEAIYRRFCFAANGDKFDQFVRSPARNRRNFNAWLVEKICLLPLDAFGRDGDLSFFFFLFPSCFDPLVSVQRDRENFRRWHQVFLVEWRRFPCKLRIYKFRIESTLIVLCRITNRSTRTNVDTLFHGVKVRREHSPRRWTTVEFLSSRFSYIYETLNCAQNDVI